MNIELFNSGGTLTSDYLINLKHYKLVESAKRQVPKRTSGEVVDFGAQVKNVSILELMLEISNSEKTTVESIFVTNSEVTIIAINTSGYWTFNGWFNSRIYMYQPEVLRVWKVIMEFKIHQVEYTSGPYL